MGYIEALDRHPPVDAKGYNTDRKVKWLYPPEHMPPPGKLIMLNSGGVTITGEWRWDGSVVGFLKLAKRDLKKEAKAVAFIQQEKEKIDARKESVDGRGRPAGTDTGQCVARADSPGSKGIKVQDSRADLEDRNADGNALQPYQTAP